MVDRNQAYLDDLFRDKDFCKWLSGKYVSTNYVRRHFDPEVFPFTVKWLASRARTPFKDRDHAKVFTMKVTRNFIIDEEKRLSSQRDGPSSPGIPSTKTPSLRLDIHDFCSRLVRCLGGLAEGSRLRGKKGIDWDLIRAIKGHGIPYEELVRDGETVGALRAQVCRAMKDIRKSIAELSEWYEEFCRDDESHKVLADLLGQILDGVGNEPS